MADWPQDCDCYTDKDGAWQMGPMCAEAEREEWRQMIKRVPHIVEDFRNSKYRLKGREVEQVELDEDGPL